MYSHKRMNNQVDIRKILNIEKRNHAVRFLKIRKLFTKTFLTTILTGFGCENIRSNVNNMFTRFYFPVNHSILLECYFFTILEYLGNFQTGS